MFILPAEAGSIHDGLEVVPGIAAEVGEGVRRAQVDRRSIRALGETPKSGFFQHDHPGIIWGNEIDARDDAPDGPIVEQCGDYGSKGREIQGVARSGVKAIDADGSRLGQVVDG